MSASLNTEKRNLLPVSLRLVRVVIGVLLGIVVVTELSLPISWQAMLSGLSGYTFLTGVFGRDPIVLMLRLQGRRLPPQALDMVAQLECLSIGSICILTGIVYHNVDSIVVRLLPFVGIYSISLCAIKYDVLGYMMQSYRQRIDPNKPL